MFVIGPFLYYNIKLLFECIHFSVRCFQSFIGFVKLFLIPFDKIKNVFIVVVAAAVVVVVVGVMQISCAARGH